MFWHLLTAHVVQVFSVCT